MKRHLLTAVAAVVMVGCSNQSRTESSGTSEEYIGKTVILGISVYDANGTLVRQTEIHGVIKRIDPATGMVLSLIGSPGEFRVPPDVDVLQEAPRGEYRSFNTGDVIEDPDFTALWEVVLPGSGEFNTRLIALHRRPKRIRALKPIRTEP